MTISNFTDTVSLLKTAVLTDEGFKRIQSRTAQNALKAAKELLEWCSSRENGLALDGFASDLFEKILKADSSSSQQRKREQIWRAFHTLRTSSSYVAKWVKFLEKSTSLPPCPIFYQFVSGTALTKARFVVSESRATASTQTLSYEEENALRYAAGYIPRALRRKLVRSSHDLKEELILCLLVDEEDLSSDIGQNSSIKVDSSMSVMTLTE